MGTDELSCLKKKCFAKRVLYVEDDLYVRDQTRKLLAIIFEDIVEASDGLLGLEAFKSSNFDIIFTDITMPNMDGLSFIKEIRKSNSSIPIIIFSAYDDTEYFIKTIELGVSGYILKPFTFQEILTSLQKIAHHFESNNKKILFLEDGFTWDLAKRALQKNGEIISLSRYESELLNLLAASKYKVFSGEEIEISVFDDDLSDNKRVRNLISRLRQKTGGKIIKNIYAEGYGLKWLH